MEIKKIGNLGNQSKLSFGTRVARSTIDSDTAPESQAILPHPPIECEIQPTPRNLSDIETDSPPIEPLLSVNNEQSPSPAAKNTTDIVIDSLPTEPQPVDATHEVSSMQTEPPIIEYDLGDVLQGKVLTRDETYYYYKKHYVPKESDELLEKTITPKTANPYTLSYQRKWLLDEKRPWHVYSRTLEGGLCKACVLFDKSEENRSTFVKRPFQDIKKSEKIGEHDESKYHNAAMKAAQEFIYLYENPDSNVDSTREKIERE